jgi:hypothetical protein
MWVTQTYLGVVEPDAKAFVYYFYEDYNRAQKDFTEQLQQELEDLGDVFGGNVSLLMPNPRYAGRIESEIRSLEPVWWKLHGKLPGLFLSSKPLIQVKEYDSDCVFVPFASEDDQIIDVGTAVQRIRALANDLVLWDSAKCDAPPRSLAERFFDAVEVKPGIWGLKLDVKRILRSGQ